MRHFVVGDIPELNRWHERHGLAPLTADLLPAIGFIVEGVAIGFLYRTDAPAIAYADGVVTNPEAPAKARHEALDAIFNAIEEAARAAGVRHVIFYTLHQVIVQRAIAHGAKPKSTQIGLHKEL